MERALQHHPQLVRHLVYRESALLAVVAAVLVVVEAALLPVLAAVLVVVEAALLPVLAAGGQCPACKPGTDPVSGSTLLACQCGQGRHIPRSLLRRISGTQAANARAHP